MPKRNAGGLTPNEQINLLSKATSGDIVMSVSPSSISPVPTNESWIRTVDVKITDSDGNVHKWLTADYTSVLTIADTSASGIASIASDTLSIVNGIGQVAVSGNASSWIATDTDTLTIGSVIITGNSISGTTSVETFTAV